MCATGGWQNTDWLQTTKKHGPKYKTQTKVKTQTNRPIFMDWSDKTRTTDYFRDRTITLHGERYVVMSRRYRY